jgi:ribosomal protein S18 acetylase RimI-like enzyme
MQHESKAVGAGVARNASAVRLRALAANDLAEAQKLSRGVRWPHRLADWEFALGLGAGYAAEIDDHVVGTAMYWRFGRRHATLGMVIVAPDWQRRGLGQQLVTAALDKLGDRSVLLHASDSAATIYERLGFSAVGELVQYEGAPFAPPVIPLPIGERLRPLGRRDAAALAKLDALAAGMPRKAALTALFESAEAVVLDRDGDPRGFSLRRRFGRGHAIGPVVAPDADRAKALIGYWLARHAGRFVRIDVPADSGLGDWLEWLGLNDVGHACAMVHGPAIERSDDAKGFAAINQALG